MTYAGNRRIIDVDSHVIEPSDFLLEAVSPEDRSLIPSFSDQNELPVISEALDRGIELHARHGAPLGI